MTELIAVPKANEWTRLKALVLDSVSSPITRRVYNLCLDEPSALRKSDPALLSKTDPGHSSATKPNDVDRSLVVDVREFVEHDSLNVLRGTAAGAGSD